MVRPHQPDAAAAALFRGSQQGGILLRRAAQGRGAHLELVLVRLHLPAPVGHAGRNRARFRHRHGPRAGDGVVARPESDGVGPARSLSQGVELDAARDPGADLRDVVRARHGLEGGARRHRGVLHRLLQRLPGCQGSEPHGSRQCPHARRERAPAAAARLCSERHELGLRQPAQLGRARLCRRGGRGISRIFARRRLPDPAGRGHFRFQRGGRGDPGAYRIRAATRLDGDARGAPPAGVAAERRRDRKDLMRLLGFLLGLAFAYAVGAQAYPSKPVRVIVPYPAGSTPDIIGRTLAERLQPAFGQPFVVENRSGAGGNIGAEAVAKAGDPHVLLIGGNGPVAINKHLYKALSFDPDKDLVPISLLATAPQLLVVKNDLNVADFKAFIEHARKNPGRLSYASVGGGSASHLTMELLKSDARVFLVHIPYRGFPAAVTDMLGGNIDAMFAIIPAVLPHVRAGKMKPLAVTALTRNNLAPDVPSVAELGLPQLESLAWNGLLAPAGTPA